MNIRLMIAEDHPIIRAGVVNLIRGTEIEVICQAETSEETVKFALTCRPDVLLLDLQLLESDGLSALEQIHRENPNIAVLIFSASEEVKTMAYARASWAPKDSCPKDRRGTTSCSPSAGLPWGKACGPRGKSARWSVARPPRRWRTRIAIRSARNPSPRQDHGWALQRDHFRGSGHRHRNRETARQTHP